MELSIASEPTRASFDNGHGSFPEAQFVFASGESAGTLFMRASPGSEFIFDTMKFGGKLEVKLPAPEPKPVQLHTVTSVPLGFCPQVGAIHSTVRLGNKYLGLLNVDQKVELTVGEKHSDRNHLGWGEIVRLEYLPFNELEERHIITNHSAASRVSLSALTAAMRRAYGSKFNPHSNVTVIFYRRVE